MDAGAELFELHAAVGEDEITLQEWKLISEINPTNYNKSVKPWRSIFIRNL